MYRFQSIVKNVSFGITSSLKFNSRRTIHISTKRDPSRNIIQVEVHDDTKFSVSPLWLRHHCRCDKCFNPLTHQRVQIPSSLKEISGINHIQEQKKKNANDTVDQELQIIWNDDHVSTFNAKWLQEALQEIICKRQQQQPTGSSQNIYNNYDNNNGAHEQVSNSMKNPDPLSLGIKYKDFMNDSDNKNAGLIQLLGNLQKYGYGIVTEVPPDVKSTKEVILKVSHPQNTIYGDFYEFSPDLTHADTAYTSDYVHLHTDATYFTEPIGLQVFHCLFHEGTGGLNSIVDGFKVAQQIKQEKPDFYEILTDSIVPWQYIDPGKHFFYSTSPIFKHDPLNGKLECIRYNPHDMASLTTIDFEKLSIFYESLVYLSKKIEENPMWFKLMPGTILFLDNFRMLHGRNEFTGQRHMAGAYISRSDYLSQCKVLLSK